MTPEQRRARGYAAQALIDDPTLQEAWKAIEDDLITEWKKPTGFNDERAQAAREGVWREIQTLGKLRQRLASFVGSSRD